MKIRIFILLIVVGLLSVSCDDFLDVNSDPNNPTEVTPDLVLPTGLNYTAEYVQQAESPNRGLNLLGNMMMFNFGESQGYNWYRQEFRYAVNSTFYDRLFDDAYSDALKQYKILSNLDGNGYYKAIGMIMETYHFQILVDLYGDVPYSEALERGQNPTPKYDKAEDIYDNLLDRLSSAISTIDSTASAGSAVKVGDGDAIFGGDMVKWKQFANSLKIRILTRLSDVKDASFINDELAKINSADGFIGDDVAINPGYLEQEEDKQNPLWDELGRDASDNETLSYKATCATQFVVDFFNGTNDTTRFNRIFESPDSGPKGIDQGQPNDDVTTQAPDKISNLKLGGGVLKSATMGSVIMTLAEQKLNMAELAEEGLNVSGTAENYYNAGVKASFNYLGAPDSAATAYLAQNTENVSYSASSNKIDAIMTQKWIATMGINAEQAWFDYNRTGYPDGQPVGAQSGTPTAQSGFPISAKAGSNQDRPLRLMYPSSEVTRNSDNVPAQPNVFTDKIFWAN